MVEKLATDLIAQMVENKIIDLLEVLYTVRLIARRSSLKGYSFRRIFLQNKKAPLLQSTFLFECIIIYKFLK